MNICKIGVIHMFGFFARQQHEPLLQSDCCVLSAGQCTVLVAHLHFFPVQAHESVPKFVRRAPSSHFAACVEFAFHRVEQWAIERTREFSCCGWEVPDPVHLVHTSSFEFGFDFFGCEMQTLVHRDNVRVTRLLYKCGHQVISEELFHAFVCCATQDTSASRFRHNCSLSQRAVARDRCEEVDAWLIGLRASHLNVCLYVWCVEAVRGMRLLLNAGDIHKHELVLIHTLCFVSEFDYAALEFIGC